LGLEEGEKERGEKAKKFHGLFSFSPFRLFPFSLLIVDTVKTWKNSFLTAILGLWGLHILWLAWHFAPEADEAGRRLVRGTWGEAVRQEDPLYRWAANLKEIIPPRAAYVFLDRYEVGKEIEAAYFLYPRRHVLLAPQAPASFLYFHLERYQASFLLVRDPDQPTSPGAKAAMGSAAFQPVKVPGPGLVFKADHLLLHGDFYD
jgi:hypothetical protein